MGGFALPFSGGFPTLPGNTFSQYADAAQGAGNAAMGAAMGAKKKKKQQGAGGQPAVPQLAQDLGAAGLGPQAQSHGVLGLHAPANFGYGGFGGGNGLMSALGQALSFGGFGQGGGGGFAGFGGGGNG